MQAFISAALIRGIPHPNEKAEYLHAHLVIFPVVPKLYPPPLSSPEPCTPPGGSFTVLEAWHTWRLASSDSTSASHI